MSNDDNWLPCAERDIVQWMELNPEAIRAFSINKSSFGRKVWWRGPNGNDYGTLRECASRAIKEYPLPKDFR